MKGRPILTTCQSSPRARRHGERKGNSGDDFQPECKFASTLNRLIDLSTENGEWEDCLRDARRVLAINPLRTDGHQAVATASEQLGQPALAISSLTSLIALSPVDPASIHYQLARAYRTSGQLEKAKEHALRTLAEAPRYRDAHQLLLEIIGRLSKEPTGKSIDGDKEVGGEQTEAKP